jgi:hypothetical protein
MKGIIAETMTEHKYQLLGRSPEDEIMLKKLCKNSDPVLS